MPDPCAQATHDWTEFGFARFSAVLNARERSGSRCASPLGRPPAALIGASGQGRGMPGSEAYCGAVLQLQRFGDVHSGADPPRLQGLSV